MITEVVILITQATLNGFYNYRPDIFDGVVLPDGMDVDTLIALIIERSGMLYVYQQQPDHLKANIRLWFNRKLPAFIKMYRALNSEYDPIENYDRKEEWTDTPDVSYTHTGKIKDHITSGGTYESEQLVSAYNQTGYSPDAKNVQKPNTTSDTTRDYLDDKTIERGTRRHEGRMHGNIGVTTNQQMIQAELSLRLYDLYDVIADLFEQHFLMQNY